MKILICGGRDFNNKVLFEKSINEVINSNDIVIHGGAIGADTLAENYCKDFNFKSQIHLPQYKIWGKVAPIIRNKEMVLECDRVVAFWDGKSRGTKNTINVASAQNKDVKIIYY